jgi:hypothetical protein
MPDAGCSTSSFQPLAFEIPATWTRPASVPSSPLPASKRWSNSTTRPSSATGSSSASMIMRVGMARNSKRWKSGKAREGSTTLASSFASTKLRFSPLLLPFCPCHPFLARLPSLLYAPQGARQRLCLLQIKRGNGSGAILSGKPAQNQRGQIDKREVSVADGWLLQSDPSSSSRTKSHPLSTAPGKMPIAFEEVQMSLNRSIPLTWVFK